MPQTLRVLVIEDNQDDQELLRRQMKNARILERVMFISDPREALDFFRDPQRQETQNGILAIIVDVNLPHIGGLDLIKILRAEQRLENIPVFVMTTNPSPETIHACSQFGVQALLTKPLTMPAFIYHIATLFHQRM